MSQFLDTANQILEAAVAARSAGGSHDDAAGFTILVNAQGGFVLIADNDWPLESLERERGARAVYRVREHGDRLFVEGRAGSQACLLAAEKPSRAARALLHAQTAFFHTPSVPSNSYGRNAFLYDMAPQSSTQ